MSDRVVAHAVEWFADDGHHGFRCYACADGPLPVWFPVDEDADPQRESEQHIADEAAKEALTSDTPDLMVRLLSSTSRIRIESLMRRAQDAEAEVSRLRAEVERLTARGEVTP